MHPRFLPRGLSVIVSVTLFLALTLVVTTAVAQRDEPNSPPSVNVVCFAVDYAVSCVNRPTLNATGTLTNQVRALIDAMLIGPTVSEQAQGLQSALPSDAKLADVRVIDRQATIDLILPQPFLDSLTDLQAEAINQQVNLTLMPYNFTWLAVNARAAAGEYRLISSFVKTSPQPHKDTLPAPSPLQSTAPSSIGEGPEVRTGLSGKTVFVSAGHGWYGYTQTQTYRAQRPVYPTSPYPAGEGIVEDFNNAELVNQYLLKYLWNSGADAWTVRERDMNTNLLIVDDASANFSTQGAWLSGSGGQAGTYRFAAINDTATATATWTFTPTTSATYAVYVWFPNVAVTRTLEAHYYVDHAGGTTPLTLIQTRDGNNWRYIGDFPFYAGQAGRVRLTNQASTNGAIVLADAVRVGGGLGNVTDMGMFAPSNKPRWEEQARQYARWVGEPDAETVSDVWIRPRYAEWEKEAGEDAVYISWHTNGATGYTPARGTETYGYLTPTVGSTTLQNAVHTELLSAIQTAWDASWPDRGQLQRDLGEVGQLTTMPGVLIENGFHDNPIDVEAIKDPRFMQLSARAIYHGLVKYWNSIDPNIPLIYLPEPPGHLIVRNSGAGLVTLSWQPGPIDGTGPLGDAATAYRVYTSADGFGWDNGTLVASTAYTLTGLTPNQLIYFKVTGLNQGGESFATPVLAARVTASGRAPILIVYGFDRIDALGDIQQDDAPEGLNRRVFIDRINRYDYIVQHADAFTRPFDSALHATVTEGLINLGSYKLVDWIAGEEQAPFPALTTTDQTALTNFLNAGNALLISGAEIGFALHSTPFYANTLHASFVNDDAATYALNSVSGSLFDGLGAISLDDSTHGTYDVDWPDVFNPIGPAASALVYNTGGSAAVQYANSCSRLVYAGVPLETIYPAATRRAVIGRAIEFLGACARISSPLDGTLINKLPAFQIDSLTATGIEVSIRRLSNTTFYNGTNFVGGPELWLTATGANPWNYALPALSDGMYALRARASGPFTDTTPAAITFTVDTIAPDVPTLITPTNDVALLAVAPQFSWTTGGQPDRFDVQLDAITHTLMSATPGAQLVVTDGVHQWRARAGDAAGNWSNWSSVGSFSTSSFRTYLPLVHTDFVSEPPTGSCTDVSVNGTFETGSLSGWTTPSTNPPPGIVSNPVHPGSFAARVGASDTTTSFGSAAYSSIQQTIAIPANAITATLSFQRYRYSGDATDLQYVALISDLTTYLLSERVNDPQWQLAQFDLTPYAGKTTQLRFSVMNNSTAGSTGLLIDDVKLMVCTP